MKVSFSKNLLVSLCLLFVPGGSRWLCCSSLCWHLCQAQEGGGPEKIDNGGDDDWIDDDGIDDDGDEEEDSRERHWSGGTWTSLGIPMDSPSILAAQCSKGQSGFSISSFEGLMIIIKIMIMMQFIS